MKIKPIITDKKRFLPLLLLADEQESMIDRYLERGDLFVMYDEGETEAIAVAVVTQEGNGIGELKNLAVAPACQRKGYGRQMINFICQHYADTCHTLLVGTGEQLHCTPSSERTDNLTHTLVDLWNVSVRATHHFLTEEDILRLTPFVYEAIRGITTLIVSYQDNQPLGFIGIEGEKIEMLFVDPAQIGKGIGKQLIRKAIENYHIRYVDVNEQNPQAAGFYRHLGFQVFEQTETDEQGNPFPILKMELKKDKQINNPE